MFFFSFTSEWHGITIGRNVNGKLSEKHWLFAPPVEVHRPVHLAKRSNYHIHHCNQIPKSDIDLCHCKKYEFHREENAIDDTTDMRQATSSIRTKVAACSILRPKKAHSTMQVINAAKILSNNQVFDSLDHLCCVVPWLLLASG
jgi:hypothetical protein